MKTRSKPYRSTGVSLVETLVAVGVLAIIVPLAMAAMVKGADVSGSARAETRAPAIADSVRIEIRAARRGESQYFEPLGAGESFGVSGETGALAFGRDGRLIGRVQSSGYASGVTELAGERVYFLAKASGRAEPGAEVVTLVVEVEYPAARPADRRKRVSFHTKLP